MLALWMYFWPPFWGGAPLLPSPPEPPPFSLPDRIWWDTTQPGAGTANLENAKTPGTPPTSEDSGFSGLRRGRLVTCDRSDQIVPESETILDPNTGARVRNRFVDPLAPAPANSEGLPRPQSQERLVREGD